jgi:hypothetical protein
MKTLLFVLGVLLASAAILVSGVMAPLAQAQNYPWCAHYGTPYSDTSCGFTSFDQCMASVSGIGGFCLQNDSYHPAATAPQYSGRNRRHSQS